MSSSFWPLRRTGRRPGDGGQGYAEFLGGAGEALRAGGGLEEAQAFERGRSSTQRTSGRDTVTLRHRTLWRWRQADCCGEAPEREVVPAPRGSAGRKARPAKHTYCNAIIAHAYGDPCVVQRLSRPLETGCYGPVRVCVEAIIIWHRDNAIVILTGGSGGTIVAG